MPQTLQDTDATSKRNRWAELKQQYAREGYLHWLGCQAAARVFQTRKTSQWDAREKCEEVAALAPEFERLDSESLQSASLTLKERARAGEPLEAYVAEAFALVRESARRVIGFYHYDVQILAGLVLCRGGIAEMATGEGKTLVQSLAAYTRALAGQGVHVATANAYLAERDHEFAQPLYEFLGITSALLPEREQPPVKRVAYEADITYGTGTEFGFDYLRDQLALFNQPKPQLGESFLHAILDESPREIEGLAQRGLHFAIVDEVDSILIDEATTPLVISRRTDGPHPAPAPFITAREIAGTLTEDDDFIIDGHAIRLTEAGSERIHSDQSVVPWEDLRRPWPRYVENALRARHLLKRDVAYVVESEGEQKVTIVDEFTGRARPESSWRDGLHQAVEAAERIEISAESESAAGISRQRFYRLYDEVAGMTGTAVDAAGEFWEVFRLPVIHVPRHRPDQGLKMPARFFRCEEAKLRAVVRDIVARRQRGQPVLVGARTIRNSENLSALLQTGGIPHCLLNARQDSGEAGIVAQAGQACAVTIATNMAGRGTHISLGEGVAERGGLHVIALEMEESRRIDLQLTGRSARQGQPGSSQMFLSADDFLIHRYAPADAERLAGAEADAVGEVHDSRWLGSFERAQSRAERLRYDTRRSLLRRDDWLSETKRRL